MTRHIIFLDIDGVVLPFGAASAVDIGLVRSSPHAHLDRLLSRVPHGPVERIKQVADQAAAKIVLISHWRGVFSHSFCEAFLERLGLMQRAHEDWFAQMRGLPPKPEKGRDIRMWLADHRSMRQSDCVVIDDDDLLLRDDWGFRNLIQIRPKPRVGFSEADKAAALLVLTGRGAARLPAGANLNEVEI